MKVSCFWCNDSVDPESECFGIRHEDPATVRARIRELPVAPEDREQRLRAFDSIVRDRNKPPAELYVKHLHARHQAITARVEAAQSALCRGDVALARKCLDGRCKPTFKIRHTEAEKHKTWCDWHATREKVSA